MSEYTSATCGIMRRCRSRRSRSLDEQMEDVCGSWSRPFGHSKSGKEQVLYVLRNQKPKKIKIKERRLFRQENFSWGFVVVLVMYMVSLCQC